MLGAQEIVIRVAALLFCEFDHGACRSSVWGEHRRLFEGFGIGATGFEPADLSIPNRALYQAELRPDRCRPAFVRVEFKSFLALHRHCRGIRACHPEHRPTSRATVEIDARS